MNQSNPFDQQQPLSPQQQQQQQQQYNQQHSTAMSPRLDTLSLQSQSHSHSPSSGARTPTTSTHPDLTLTLPPSMSSSMEFRHTGPMTPPAHVGASRPTTGITIGDTMGGTSGIGFGLKEPPKMRRAMTKDGNIVGGAGGAKSGLSVSSSATPDGGWQDDAEPGQTQSQTPVSSQESSSAGNNDRARAIRGTLTVKLISARNLAVGSGSDALGSAGGKPEPYVVAQFEQNEFVSRPALVGDANNNGQDGQQQQQQQQQTQGKTIPRTNSYGPSLGIASISRAFADAARRTKGGAASGGGKSGQGTGGLTSGQTTPRAGGPAAGGGGPASPGLGGSFFGKIGGSTADPVWKEDVSL